MDDQLSVTFAALADPTRRAILERLARGDATVGELAEPFAMSLPAISKHIAALERAGLVAKSVHGQHRSCRVTVTPLKNAYGWIETYRRHWEANLENLDAYLVRLQATTSEPSAPRVTTPEPTRPEPITPEPPSPNSANAEPTRSKERA
jgi:DNA-binding transcriptional ArsR family regulator